MNGAASGDAGRRTLTAWMFARESFGQPPGMDIHAALTGDSAAAVGPVVRADALGAFSVVLGTPLLIAPQWMLNAIDNVLEMLREMTGGRGPDACIDCVGLESHHPHPVMYGYDRIKQAARLETERGFALREAMLACRNGGIVSIMGVYGGFMDKFPIGSVMNRSLTIKSGQAHVHRYLRPLLSASRTGRSTLASSSPTTCHSTTPRSGTRCSSTSRTTA
jgi:hypothetical protein